MLIDFFLLLLIFSGNLSFMIDLEPRVVFIERLGCVDSDDGHEVLDLELEEVVNRGDGGGHNVFVLDFLEILIVQNQL